MNLLNSFVSGITAKEKRIILINALAKYSEINTKSKYNGTSDPMRLSTSLYVNPLYVKQYILNSSN